MARDLFRRMILFSPELIEESADTGTVSPETWQVIMGGPPGTAVNPLTAQAMDERRTQAEQFNLVQMRGPNQPTITPKLNILGTDLAKLLGYKVEERRQQDRPQGPQLPDAPDPSAPQIPQEPSMPQQPQQPFQLPQFFGGEQARASGANLGQRSHRHMEENFAGPEFLRR